MITKILLALKKWALPVVIAYILGLTYLSLTSISNIPSLGSDFDDKIYHSFAYFILTLLLYNFVNSIRNFNALLISVVIAVFYGIIVEVLQYVLTTWRTFDVFDAIANTIGAILASILIGVCLKWNVKIK